MGLKDAILQKVLRVVDDTIGKKFKIIDDITDLFQGAEARIDDLEERLNKLEEKYNENQYEKESRRNSEDKKKSEGQ